MTQVKEQKTSMSLYLSMSFTKINLEALLEED